MRMDEIKKLIEEKIGYKFKLEELPPHLRAQCSYCGNKPPEVIILL